MRYTEYEFVKEPYLDDIIYCETGWEEGEEDEVFRTLDLFFLKSKRDSLGNSSRIRSTFTR